MKQKLQKTAVVVRAITVVQATAVARAAAGARAVAGAWAAAAALAIAALTTAPLHAADLPLARQYSGGIDLPHYWVSEKFDGVRARWDGERLISRGGNAFSAPAWFTAGFPSAPLDGELWAGRGLFSETASIVTRAAPHEGWRRIRYLVFDLPAPGIFNERLRQLREMAAGAASPYLEVVQQRKVSNHAALMKTLDTVTAGGGEGLMLRDGRSRYRGGRSSGLLKLKKFEDAEARVIAHHPGKGKFTGMTGSISVQPEHGAPFRIGSGFTDAQRKNPPPIGTLITYKHHGHTATGLPRFPIFWRLRADDPER